MVLNRLPVILLAPSEDKATGGVKGRLSETPAQRWTRERLVTLARRGSLEAQSKAFQVKDLALGRARAEALALGGTVPLLPALERYTGVAFLALDADSLPRTAWKRIYVLSNLRGLVRGDEPVPSYKLKLTGLPGLKAHWRTALPPLLEGLPAGPVWELLPGEYGDLLKGWARGRHTVEILDARGKAISHFSKKFRGLVARWLVEHGEGEPGRVLKGHIPGCQWLGLRANDRGGSVLSLRVEP